MGHYDARHLAVERQARGEPLDASGDLARRRGIRAGESHLQALGRAAQVGSQGTEALEAEFHHEASRLAFGGTTWYASPGAQSQPTGCVATEHQPWSRLRAFAPSRDLDQRLAIEHV